MSFEVSSEEVSYHKIYLNRMQELLKEMAVSDPSSVEIFRYYSDKIQSICEVYYYSGDFEDMMDSLDILQAHHRKLSKINIATLNFSGINTNPF
jgi:hypothetical protein